MGNFLPKKPPKLQSAGPALTPPLLHLRPDLRFSPHDCGAPEYSGCCHQHSLNRYQYRPIGKCAGGGERKSELHYVKDVYHKKIVLRISFGLTQSLRYTYGTQDDFSPHPE